MRVNRASSGIVHGGGMMTFRDTLDRHLLAIRNRDLSELIATLPEADLTLVTSDGRLVRTTAEMVEMHRDWFVQTAWSLDVEIVSLVESPELGVVLLRLDYRDDPPGQPPIRQASYLTLVFALRDGRWVMVHDQNTPSKA
jgi:ketosteroid isomerase-like protein